MNTNLPVVSVVLETASLVFRQTVRGEDSFFELGIDSLTMMEYCRRLEERLSIEIEVEELFASEDLASFGAALAARASTDKTT